MPQLRLFILKKRQLREKMMGVHKTMINHEMQRDGLLIAFFNTGNIGHQRKLADPSSKQKAVLHSYVAELRKSLPKDMAEGKFYWVQGHT